MMLDTRGGSLTPCHLHYLLPSIFRGQMHTLATDAEVTYLPPLSIEEVTYDLHNIFMEFFASCETCYTHRTSVLPNATELSCPRA